MTGYKVVLNNYKNISLLGDVTYDTNEVKTSSYADGYRGFFFYPSFHSIPLSILEFSSSGTVTPVKLIEVETDDEAAEYKCNEPGFSKNMMIETWKIKRVDSLKEYSPAEYLTGLINEYSNASVEEILSHVINNQQHILLHVMFMSYNGIDEEEIKKILKIDESAYLTKSYYKAGLFKSIDSFYGNAPLSIAYQYGLARINGEKPDEILKKFVTARSRRDHTYEDASYWISLAQLELDCFKSVLLARYFKDR